MDLYPSFGCLICFSVQLIMPILIFPSSLFDGFTDLLPCLTQLISLTEIWDRIRLGGDRLITHMLDISAFKKLVWQQCVGV